MRPSPPNSLLVFKNKPFARFARKVQISDVDLWKAAIEANEGRIDANLGGGVIKQRIALRGKGKSGGSRSIILFRKGDRAVFVFGFEKKDMANITPSDLIAFREFASIYLTLPIAEMNELVRQGVLHSIEAPKEKIDG